jgi:DNA-binding NarL/FixJ family response regulator
VSEPIRVALVDDHAMIRAGLQQLIDGTDDIEVVGTAADGASALELVREHHPDVVLMDLQMPGVDGVSATRAIKAEGGSTDVLVLTSYSDGERIVAALEAGAVGYLLKDADPDDVLQGIRAVSRGESPIHPRAARQLLGIRMGGPPRRDRRPPGRRARARRGRRAAARPPRRAGARASPPAPTPGRQVRPRRRSRRLARVRRNVGAQLARRGDRLAAGRHVELAQDVLDV